MSKRRMAGEANIDKVLNQNKKGFGKFGLLAQNKDNEKHIRQAYEDKDFSFYLHKDELSQGLGKYKQQIRKIGRKTGINTSFTKDIEISIFVVVVLLIITRHYEVVLT